jgi:hypothetical protein
MARTPTDPTKAQVWITKGLDDLDFEFYFPQGPKGDAGGFTLGTALDNVSDTGTGKYNLNDVVVSGIYRMTATNDGLLLRNYPRNYDTGILEVFERVPGQTILQVWHSINQTARLKYERTYVTGVWSPWRLYTTTRVDQTAGRAMYVFDDLNGREQLVYGDTGMREVSSLVNAAFFDSSGVTRQLFIRRTNNLVSVSGQMLSTASTSSVSALTIPNGFRPQSVVEATCLNIRSASSWARVNTAGGGANTMSLISGPNAANGGFIAGDVFNIGVTWMTNDTWPSSLPGNASGGVANI